MNKREALKWMTRGVAVSVLTACTMNRALYNQTKVDWGIFGGELDKTKQLVKTTGGRNNLIGTFVGWTGEGTPDKRVVEYANEGNRKMIIFWEAYTPGADPNSDPAFKQEAIMSGRYDGYISKFADSLKDTGINTILFPFPEANNGNSVTNNFNGNETKFSETLDHVAKFFEDIHNVEIGLSLNFTLNPEELNGYSSKLAKWIGLSVFNFGEPRERWMDYETLARPTIDKVSKWKRKIMIASIGCAPDPRRIDWITDATKKILEAGYPVNYFMENKDPKDGRKGWERNWELNNDELKALGKLLNDD